MQAMSTMLCGAMIAGTALGLGAQAPDGSANRAAMERLAGMTGRYRGTAWMMNATGKRDTTTMVETIERRLDGTVMLIEGVGTARGAAGESRVVHHALAVLAFDAAGKSYTLRSYLANGLWGDFPVSVTADGLQWTREVPGGRIRNTAHIGNGEWNETGEFSRDGVTWNTIMEIRIKREN